MARGFLRGVALGGVVSLAAAALVSLAYPVTPRPDRLARADTADTAVPKDGRSTSGTGMRDNGTTTAARVPGRVDFTRDAPEPGAIADRPLDGTGDGVSLRPQISGGGDARPDPLGPVPRRGEEERNPKFGDIRLNPPRLPRGEETLSVSNPPAMPSVTAPTGRAGFGERLDIGEPPRAPSNMAPRPGSTATAALPQLPSRAGPPRVSDRADRQPPSREEPRRAIAQVPAAPATRPRNSVADIPPIEAFSVPVSVPPGQSTMAIVLIDDAGSLGAEALSAFPYPLTIGIEAGVPGAEEKMRRYRESGHEVVALVNLPDGAGKAEAELALARSFARLPEAVAVLEGTRTGLQGNRALSTQITDSVLGTGHGLVLQDNGLNTVQKLARRAGVPSAVVFRDFDKKGQDPTTIRRFLDQGASRARLQGSVIMLGRVRPDTISALLLWGLQDHKDKVALVPISTALTSGGGIQLQ